MCVVMRSARASATSSARRSSWTHGANLERFPRQANGCCAGTGERRNDPRTRIRWRLKLAACNNRGVTDMEDDRVDSHRLGNPIPSRSWATATPPLVRLVPTVRPHRPPGSRIVGPARPPRMVWAPIMTIEGVAARLCLSRTSRASSVIARSQTPLARQRRQCCQTASQSPKSPRQVAPLAADAGQEEHGIHPSGGAGPPTERQVALVVEQVLHERPLRHRSAR